MLLPCHLLRNLSITFKWYFFCKDCRKRPVYIPHIHQPNKKLSKTRNGGLIQPTIAVPAARAIPPSTQMAWHKHGLVQVISSLNLSTLRPNRTHGQNSPIKPVMVENENFYTIETWKSNTLSFCSKCSDGIRTSHKARCNDTINNPIIGIQIFFLEKEPRSNMILQIDFH